MLSKIAPKSPAVKTANQKVQTNFVCFIYLFEKVLSNLFVLLSWWANYQFPTVLRTAGVESTTEMDCGFCAMP